MLLESAGSFCFPFYPGFYTHERVHAPEELVWTWTFNIFSYKSLGCAMFKAFSYVVDELWLNSSEG